MSANPTEAEVASTVRAFEKRTQAFQYRVRGISLWQLVRFDVSTRLQGLDLTRAAIGRQRLVAALLKAPWQLLRLGKARYLGKTFDSAFRRDSVQGYQDVYFDDLRPAIPDLATMSSCDAPGYERKLGKAAVPPRFDDTSVIVLSALLGRVFPKVRHDAAFDAVSGLISAELGIAYSSQALARLYNVFAWRVVLYRRVLARFAPRAVLCPDSGQFALMRAAELAGIAFIELQHGVFSGAHANALPSDLSADEAAGLLLPSKLAVYGRFAAEQLSHTWLAANGRIQPVGAPFLSGVESRPTERAAGAVPHIALTTQGVGRQALVDFMTQFLAECSAAFVLTVRLHPAYDADATLYQQSFAADQRVIIQPGTSTESTHNLIARADLHLSISSACHFDALGLGTPTGILALETHESVAAVLKADGAMLIKTPSDLARIVSEQAFGSVPESTSRYFFEADFNGQLTRLLEELTTAAPSVADSQRL